jgi:hypothetical protein
VAAVDHLVAAVVRRVAAGVLRVAAGDAVEASAELGEQCGDRDLVDYVSLPVILLKNRNIMTY